MYNSEDIDRIRLIRTKIEYILEICSIGIVKALEDEKITKPAIMMHLTSIAEQFSKIKNSELLSNFDNEDVKGAIDTRNFIAHDYEDVIKQRLPIIKQSVLNILNTK